MVRRSATTRRAAAIATIVVVLATVHLVTVAAVAAGADDAQVGALRVETARAFYAAESGAVTAMRAIRDGDDPPAAGSRIDLGGAFVEFIEVPPRGTAGELVVEGRSGFARRRLGLLLD